MDYYNIQHITNAIASFVILYSICEQLGDACHLNGFTLTLEHQWHLQEHLCQGYKYVGRLVVNTSTMPHALKQY